MHTAKATRDAKGVLFTYNRNMSNAPKKNIQTASPLVKHFVRDLSLELFDAPPATETKGDKELQCNITLHTMPHNGGKMLEIVVATRLFIHTRQTGQGLLLADHAYIGLFDTSAESTTEDPKALQKRCAETLYPIAQKSLKGYLQQSGYNPPLPESIDIDQMLENKGQ